MEHSLEDDTTAVTTSHVHDSWMEAASVIRAMSEVVVEQMMVRLRERPNIMKRNSMLSLVNLSKMIECGRCC